jgi:hypothetical protein
MVFYSGFLNEAHRRSRGSVDCLNVARLDQIRVAEGEKEMFDYLQGYSLAGLCVAVFP